jgi:3-hydroxyacyl-[acyl-carrier-protein] dehydratase
MRWMWIDAITKYEAATSLVAIKNISLAESHLHDYPVAGEAVMPASLIIEGMAQTAGILVGTLSSFKEKVILAKITNATLEHDARPGQTLRYTATIQRADDVGASTTGTVELRDHTNESQWRSIGVIDLMFSQLDQNMQGLDFPKENFVFSDNFRQILTASGLKSLVPA